MLLTILATQIAARNLSQRLKRWPIPTRIGTEGERICIETPLIDLKKEEIILRGAALGVDYSKTVSCYQLTEAGTSCGVCDSCRIRKAGFAQAGMEDPTCY